MPPLQFCALVVLALQQRAADMTTRQAGRVSLELAWGYMRTYMHVFLVRTCKAVGDGVIDVCGGSPTAILKYDLAGSVAEVWFVAWNDR